MGWTSRDFLCEECGAAYDDTVQYDEMTTIPCRYCGHNYLTVLISIPRIQKQEIEMKTHDGIVSEDGRRVALSSAKSWELTRAQRTAEKAMQEATRKGDAEGAADASKALQGLRKETKKLLRQDRPAQDATYNGSKV